MYLGSLLAATCILLDTQELVNEFTIACFQLSTLSFQYLKKIEEGMCVSNIVVLFESLNIRFIESSCQKISAHSSTLFNLSAYS